MRWLGNLFIVTGLWGQGDKQRHAFLASIVGESIWIAAAYRSSDWALCAICTVFATLAARAWWKWR